MNFVTATDAVQDFFDGVVDPVEIRDPSGKVLGCFTPALSAEEAKWYERAKALFDPDEMERIFAAEHNQGRPLADIWKELESREAPQ
jgi:hypothetical protein